MSRASQLGPPLITYEVDGQFSLVRFHSILGTGNPVTPVNINSIQQVSPMPMTPQQTREVFQFGGGEESLLIERIFRGGLSLQMKAGYLKTFLQTILNITLDPGTGIAGIPLRFQKYPLGFFECVFRREDNETHMFSMIFQDVILDQFNFDAFSMSDGMVTVPFTCKHDSVLIEAPGELVVETFSGDGSTTVFSLSDTPIDIVDTAGAAKEDWEFDDLVYVGVQASGADTHTRQRSGVTYGTGDVTFATAPAASSKIIVPYIIDGDAV